MLQCFKKGNILRSGRMLYGYIYENIYQIKNGKLKCVAGATYSVTSGFVSASKGKKKMSKKEYDAYIKKISKKSKYFDLQYKNKGENLL